MFSFQSVQPQRSEILNYLVLCMNFLYAPTITMQLINVLWNSLKAHMYTHACTCACTTPPTTYVIVYIKVLNIGILLDFEVPYVNNTRQYQSSTTNSSSIKYQYWFQYFKPCYILYFYQYNIICWCIWDHVNVHQLLNYFIISRVSLFFRLYPLNVTYH